MLTRTELSGGVTGKQAVTPVARASGGPLRGRSGAAAVWRQQRLSWVVIFQTLRIFSRSAADPHSGSKAVERGWLVGNVGARAECVCAAKKPF